MTTELGLGGVRGLGEYYETRVLAYHRTMERWVEKLENKFATLIAYKVRGSLGSSSTRATSSVSVGSGAGNRFVSASLLTLLVECMHVSLSILSACWK